MAKNIFENNTTASYVTNVNNAPPVKEKAHIYFYTIDSKEETDEDGLIENIPVKLNMYVKTVSGRKFLWTRFMNSPESVSGTQSYVEAILDRDAKEVFAAAESMEDICDKLLKREFIFEIGKDQRVTIKTERTETHTKVIPDLV